jgi:hypothetical protein
MSPCDLKVRKSSRRSGRCQSRVLGEDYKNANQADEQCYPEQGETGPLGLREIDQATVIVQRV